LTGPLVVAVDAPGFGASPPYRGLAASPDVPTTAPMACHE
jgi:hypothetical protein